MRTLKSNSLAELVKTQVPVPIKSIMLIILIIVVSLVIMIIYSLFFVSLSVNNYNFQSGTTEVYLVKLSLAILS